MGQLSYFEQFAPFFLVLHLRCLGGTRTMVCLVLFILHSRSQAFLRALPN